MDKKFYPSVEEEKVNEIYNPEWMNIKADDNISTYTKKAFREVVMDIQRKLSTEDFTEVQIEDYIKSLIEDIVQ